MEVSDFTMKSKGAAVAGAKSQTKESSQFTYVVADSDSSNLHVYSCEENENWINCRDNGKSLIADSSLVDRLVNKYNSES